MGGGTSNLQAGEIFKIHNGKIHEIEAMGVSSGGEGGIHPARSFSFANRIEEAGLKAPRGLKSALRCHQN
jgi:hypothetical protein